MKVKQSTATVLLLWWDYACDACGQTGSCPVPSATPVFDAARVVRMAHRDFNPECDRNNSGFNIRVWHVGESEL